MELLNTRGQAMGPSNHLAQVMRRYPLVCYFLLALGLTWLYEVPIFGLLHLPINHWGIPDGFLGPTVSAFIMTALTEGKPGVRRLLQRYVLWRVGLPWYLVVLLSIPALMLLGTFLLFGAAAAFPFRAPALLYLVNYVGAFMIVSITGSALSEEPGWRGFALPRLEQRAGPLVGTLLLGGLWSLWHLPLFLFIPGYHGAGILIPFVAFLVGFLALSIIMTWVFNNTRGSLLLAILLHASLNTTWFMLTWTTWGTLSAIGPVNVNVPLGFYLSFVVAALVLIVATRGRLSYERYLREKARLSPVTDQGQEKGEVGPRPSG